MNTPTPTHEAAEKVAKLIHSDYEDLADNHTGNDFNCSCPEKGRYDTDDYCPTRTLKSTTKRIENVISERDAFWLKQMEPMALELSKHHNVECGLPSIICKTCEALAHYAKLKGEGK